MLPIILTYHLKQSRGQACSAWSITEQNTLLLSILQANYYRAQWITLLIKILHCQLLIITANYYCIRVMFELFNIVSVTEMVVSRLMHGLLCSSISSHWSMQSISNFSGDSKILHFAKLDVFFKNWLFASIPLKVYFLLQTVVSMALLLNSVPAVVYYIVRF